MRPPLFSTFAAFLTAVVIIGCGGGGGGGGTGGSGGSGGTSGEAPLAGQYLEFLGVNRPGNLEPLSLVRGDEVQIVVANYDPSGNRTVLNSFNWRTNAPSSGATLSSSGRLRILRSPLGIFGVSASVNLSTGQKVVSQDFSSPPASSTTISGKVVQQGVNRGVKYVQVNFYDQSGAVIAATRTGDKGLYRASVPTNVKSASIKGASVPAPPFYKSFLYGGKVYAMDASDCLLSIGTLRAGQNNPLGNMGIFRQDDGPPPPPDGCGN